MDFFFNKKYIYLWEWEIKLSHLQIIGSHIYTTTCTVPSTHKTKATYWIQNNMQGNVPVCSIYVPYIGRNVKRELF